MPETAYLLLMPEEDQLLSVGGDFGGEVGGAAGGATGGGVAGAGTHVAAGGSNGLAALTQLGARPAYTPDVVEALACSPCSGASERLLELAARHDSPLPIVEALGRRLAAGHPDAGSALLALGRQGAARAAA